jgi:hypothetical protein
MISQAYIFLCANSTEKECLTRLLFGGKEAYKKGVPSVNPGDKLFLFNYQTGMLHGTFKATSNAEMNIEPTAWVGQFPWQVKVEQIKKYKPLSRADLVGVLTFIRKKYPPAKVTEEQVQDLEQLFESEKRLPVFEDNIPYIAEDGHRVRSRGELAIDNWLYKNNIVHAYEKQLSNADGVLETMHSDFFIPSSNTYIEFWGMDDKKYMKRKEEKIDFYKTNNLNLISVSPENIKDLDKILEQLRVI